MGDATGSVAYNIFAGHLGHLSTSQEKALVEFKKALVEAKLYDPAKSPDDPTLLCVMHRRRLRRVSSTSPGDSCEREALILQPH
jgi:hypothetical protein